MAVSERPLTPKGERHSQAIVEAAMRCLARDGYGGTSLQRVADEAGLGKRTVLYYYRSREELFARVVRHAGDQVLDQIEDAIEGLEDPGEILSSGFDRLWSSLTTDRALLIAWYGLLVESVTNPALQGSTQYVSGRARDLLRRKADEAEARGIVLHAPRDSMETLILAALQGLLLDYLENGDTPRLQAAARDFQALLTRFYSSPA